MSFAQSTAMGSSEMAHRGNSNPMMNPGQSDNLRRSGISNGSGPNGAKQRKKAGKSKGRKMMIKIFYSLQSPRLGSTPAPVPSTPAASAASPDFFSVLDPSLSASSTAAPTPAPVPPQDPATNYSCIARLSAPVPVQVIGSKKNSSNGSGSEERAQFGRVTLKTCLSAICISRPELVMDSTKDFSVSAVDPFETSNRRQALSSSSSYIGQSSGGGSTDEPGQGVVEGKGMLSWTLAEKKEGTTMVCGRISGSESESRRSKRRRGEDGHVIAEDPEDEESESGDESDETLELWLQLSERDAFTQGQFLDCLRSYHNPVQQLQSELSEFHSSPPKPNRTEIPSFSSSSTLNSGDPVKRKRPQSRQSLPLSASTTALPLAPPSAFANLSAPSHPLSAPVPSTSAEPNSQSPDLLALLSQLVSSASTPSQADTSASSFDPSQNQQALQSLARLCGLPVPEAPLPPAPSTQAPTSTSGPAPKPSARPPKVSTSVSNSATNSTSSATSGKKREHFTPIDAAEIKGQGKNNPRDPNGCSNCKRKKSTVWREGLEANGVSTTVCNACGIYFNKHGYHRLKTGAEQGASNSSRPLPSDASTSTTYPKSGRPLTGRLTATCEADLNKRKARRKVSNGSPDSSTSSRIFGGGSGIVPPLSPSKHVGPRSPSLAFGFSSSSRAGSSRAPGIMSSPGRSPRLRQRPGATQGTAATSPLRAPADAFALDGGFDFTALFGGHASPSPRKRTLSGNHAGGSGEKGVPNYLLTASPGTALDRILNDTNIGSLSSLGEPMQVDVSATGEPSNSFNFFLQPGSPSREQKENERPRASTVGPSSAPADAPVTDADSFESVLSSLRRDFNNRLSSNALTAPSSPVPSSPCVQPRTSTATPGSKGKAPLSSGRAPPSIFDSFTDGLVTGIVLDEKVDETGTTPHSDSDAWSPPGADDDKTLTFNSLLQSGNKQKSGETGGGSHKTRSEEQYNHDLSHLLVPNKMAGNGKRAAFIPSHLVPASDATDFDLGSLPPSSPPQLPSETFPTPSDFDGVTPGTEGGDSEDRERSTRDEPDRLVLEAAVKKIATEPNDEIRSMVMSLLQSGGTAATKGDASSVELSGVPGGDKITLDRSTVDQILALISSKSCTAPDGLSHSPQAADASSAPSDVVSKAAETSTGPSTSQDSPDLSQIDFFNAFTNTSQSQEMHHSEQMNGLYSDLFSSTRF